MKLSELELNAIGRVYGGDVDFASISTDTRSLKPGQLFIALRGENFDAHEKIDLAEAAGACAVVLEKPVKTQLPYLLVEDSYIALGKIGALYRLKFTGCVVGLTGSSGKTSVKGMLKSIFDVKHLCCATEGNLNNHIGVPLTLARINPNAEFAIVEAGTSGRGEIGYLSNLIQANIALVINVQAAHLEGFGGLASIAKEKSAMYAGSKLEVCVVNLDDENCDILYAAAKKQESASKTKMRLVGFSQGRGSSALYQVDDLVTGNGIDFDKLGCPVFKLQINNQSRSIALNVLGEHAIENALAAAATAHAAGISIEQIKTGLESFSGIPGRMEIRKGFNGAVLVNDSYNANPGSMMAAIDFLARHKNSLLICGDMAELGQDAQQLHIEVGQYARRKNIGMVLSVGELSKLLSAELGSSGKHFATQVDLIDAARHLLSADSVVLVKGSRSAKMEVVVNALTVGGVN